MIESWLKYPLQLTGSREFSCKKFTPEECDYYMRRWHFWYVADYVYALPTTYFFLSGLGLFIIGYFTSEMLSFSGFRGGSIWRKLVAAIRYLTYRGFHVRSLNWTSAPVGLLLLGFTGALFFFCMTLIPQPYYWHARKFGGSPPLGTRAGWMALACLPFVIATASKTNWITLLTGVSHERLQLFHRWTAYAFFVLALVHTFPFIVYHIHFGDMVFAWEVNNLFYWTGIVAIIFQAWLTFASHSVFRKLGYEFFKATHFFSAVVFILIFFIHCNHTLTSWHYFVATAAVYVPCFAYSWIRTLLGHRFNRKAYLQVEENGFTRITIPVKNITWRPGQHCFLRFTSFGLQCLSSHPFTICSLPPSGQSPGAESEMVFYIRHQRGLTEKIYNHALANPGAAVPVLIDGPYGGINMTRFKQADRLIIAAGGSGAGWILPFVELFARRADPLHRQHENSPGQDDSSGKSEADRGSSRSSSQSTPAKPSLRVVLATREPSSRLWFQRALAESLSKYDHAPASLASIAVQVYLTAGSKQEAEIFGSATESDKAGTNTADEVVTSPQPPTFQSEAAVRYGRPELPSLIREEAEGARKTGESLSVFVCGPDAMMQDVRNAVAAENLRLLKGSGGSGEIYLHTEHFSWA